MIINEQNIVVLTIGRCGSTVLCRMATAAGWVLPDADPEYLENRQFVAFNERILRGQSPSSIEKRAFLERLTPAAPWILKDPRFVWTHDAWPMLSGNLLIWLRRDLEAVEKSLRARRWGRESPAGVWTLRGYTLAEHERRCREIFYGWDGPRLNISYERLEVMCGMFTGPTQR